MDFEKICMVFTMKEPYYGILLSSMERIPTKKETPTMAVGRSGNVFRLYYNTDFTDKLSIDATLELLKHEVLHIAFNHFSIWENTDVPSNIHELRNIAADMEVNGYLDIDKIKDLSPILAAKFGWNNYLGTREYFSRLMDEANKQQEKTADSPSLPCNGGMSGNTSDNTQSSSAGSSQDNDSDTSSSNTGGCSGSTSGGGGNVNSKDPVDSLIDSLPDSIDDHSQWPDSSDSSMSEQLQQAIDDMLILAAEEVEKNRGEIPREMTKILTNIRNKKKAKPVADWRRYMRRYLGNEFTEVIKKSKKRESRRFPDAAGNRHRRKSNIIVAIDTSGSISMPEYNEFFSQIKTLTATSNFHVIECDATIQYEYDYKNKPNETPHGGGGTSFTPVIDYFIKNKKNYDTLVYFTDGYAPIPKHTPKETLWVISSNGDQTSRDKYRVNGASVAFIPKKQV